MPRTRSSAAIAFAKCSSRRSRSQLLPFAVRPFLAVSDVLVPADLIVDLIAVLGVVGKNFLDLTDREVEILGGLDQVLTEADRLDDIRDAEARAPNEARAATGTALHEGDRGVPSHAESLFDQLLRERAPRHAPPRGLLSQSAEGAFAQAE